MRQAGWIVIGALTLWGWAPAGLAQDAAKPGAEGSPQKIGFVNLDTIEAGWIEYQILKRDMEKFFQVDKRDIQRLRQDIEKREGMLEERRRRGTISDRDYKNFRQYLALQRRKVDIYTEIRALIVQDKVDQQRERADRIVEEVIQKMGEEESYDLILNSADLIGEQPELDISRKVVNVLNASDAGLTGPSTGSSRF